MTRAAIYARISESDVKIPAIKNQIANLERLAAAEGYTIVRTYSDDGISAYSGKRRPGFLDLVAGVRNKEFDLILAVAEDRFTRSSEEKIGLQGDCVRAGITWHTLAGGRVDPSTASGGLLATITGAVAQYESALKVERIQRSVADRLAAGKDLGGPRPFGFEPDRTTIREHEAEVLRAAYAAVLEGDSLYKIAKSFDAAGVKRDRAPEGTWRPQTVRSILLRERNCGRLVVKGVQYADDFPPIIDTDTFDRVRAILENPARAPRRGPKGANWAATGVVRCGVCGGYLTQTQGRGGVRGFRCAADGRTASVNSLRHPGITAAKLDAMLCALVWLTLHFRVIMERDVTATPAPVAALRLRVAELVRQRDVAQDLALSPGANVAHAKKKISALAGEIGHAQKALDEALAVDVTTAALASATAVAEAAMTGAEHPEELFGQHWARLSVDDRRALIRALLPSPKLWPTTAEMRLTPQ